MVARRDAANRCPECTGNAPEGVRERQKKFKTPKKHLSDVRPGREVKALKAKDRRDSLRGRPTTYLSDGRGCAKENG